MVQHRTQRESRKGNQCLGIRYSAACFSPKWIPWKLAKSLCAARVKCIALVLQVLVFLGSTGSAEGQSRSVRTWWHKGAGWSTYSPEIGSAKTEYVRGRFLSLEGNEVQIEGHPVDDDGQSMGAVKDRVWTADFDEIGGTDRVWIEDQLEEMKRAKAATDREAAQATERRRAEEVMVKREAVAAQKAADLRRLTSGTRLSHQVNQTALICAGLALLLSITDLRRRQRLGARFGELNDQGFREVSAIHQTVTVARWPLAIFGLGLGLISITMAFHFLGKLFDAEWTAALGRLIVLGLFALGTWLVWRAFVSLTDWVDGRYRTQGTDVTIQEAVEGIDESEIRELGRDRFPEGAVFDSERMRIPRTRGLWITGAFSAVTFGLGLVVWLAEKPGQLLGLSEWLRAAALERCVSLSSWSPWSELIGAVSTGLTVCLYLHNRKYQVLGFARHWWCYLGAAGVGSLFVTAWHPSFALTWVVVLAFGLMAFSRLRAELAELRGVEAREYRFGPLRRAMEVGGQKLLDRVQNGGFFQFPPLDLKALDRVLDESTREIERSEYLCTPRFARSMKDALVRWLRMVVLEYRQMTVFRTTVLRNARPTIEPLRYPKVPVWDEQQFPLVVPEGYVSRVDEKLLGPEWIVVQICGGCGGTGRVNCGNCGGKGYNDRTRTETQNGRTVTHSYRETCSTCSGTGRVTCSRCQGTGRLMWDQAIQTIWEREVVNVSEPLVLNDDFLDDAMQRVFWQKTLLENRQPVVSADTTPQEIDEADLLRLGHLMKDGIAHADKQSSATLYRMDLRLGGCLVHKVVFPLLGGLEGWIFGKRGSVFMPTEPFSFQRAAIFSLLPPMVIAASIYAFSLALRLAEWAGVRA